MPSRVLFVEILNQIKSDNFNSPKMEGGKGQKARTGLTRAQNFVATACSTSKIYANIEAIYPRNL